MLRVYATAITAVLVAATMTGTAGAYTEWQKVFVAEYVPKSNKDYYKLVRKQAKCNVCHQGKDRENNNAYGQHVDKLLDKGDKKDKAKVVEALKEVAKIHSVEGDENSPTYGDLIAAGKLPVDLEEAKKEPDGD